MNNLDRWFPRTGPCLICGTPGLDARHRVIDAITDRVLGGEDQQEVADDYNVSLEAVQAAVSARAVDELTQLGQELGI